MIKAVLLVVAPAATWDRIVQAARGFLFVMALYLMPMAVLSLAGELAGRLHWGRPQAYGDKLVFLSSDLAVQYGIAQVVLSILMVLLAAVFMKSFAEAFNTRYSYTACFNLAAYTLSPLFLVRAFDGFPSFNPWMSFSLGIFLSVVVLYQGLPRLLRPDPARAFGLYVSSAVVLAFLGGIVRLLTLLVLDGKLKLH